MLNNVLENLIILNFHKFSVDPSEDNSSFIVVSIKQGLLNFPYFNSFDNLSFSALRIYIVFFVFILKLFLRTLIWLFLL